MAKTGRCSPGNENRTCQFCMREVEDELKLGKLYSVGDISAHHYCLLFSSNLLQAGEKDDEGILGFLPKDITLEIKRGKRLRCCFCKLTGATIGCVCKICRRAYHLPCGLEHDILLQFFGTFPTYCKDHRFQQEPIQWNEKRVICAICLENVTPKVSSSTLYPPCCKNGWFHKSCVQMQAVKSGYFFRCPLCNNQTEFNEEMEKFGVYIPEQDASWEREPGAFSDMYEQHSHCDVPNCICPRGRKFDEDTVGESLWELVRCQTCGSQGTHIGCSKLPLVSPEWNCSNCLTTVDRLETSTKKVKLRKRKTIRARKKKLPCRTLRRKNQVRYSFASTSHSSSSSDEDRNSSPPPRRPSSRSDKQTNPERKRPSQVGISPLKGTEQLNSDSSASSISVVKEDLVLPSSPPPSRLYRQRRFSASSSPSNSSSPSSSSKPSAIAQIETKSSQRPFHPNSDPDLDDSFIQPKSTEIGLKRSAPSHTSSVNPVKKMNLSQSPTKPFGVSSSTNCSSAGVGTRSPNKTPERHHSDGSILDSVSTKEEEVGNVKPARLLQAKSEDPEVVITICSSDESSAPPGEDEHLKETVSCSALGKRNDSERKKKLSRPSLKGSSLVSQERTSQVSQSPDPEGKTLRRSSMTGSSFVSQERPQQISYSPDSESKKLPSLTGFSFVKQERASNIQTSSLFSVPSNGGQKWRTPLPGTNLPYRQYSCYSSSDSEKSDQEQPLKPSVQLTCRSDSPPVSGHSQISPTFNLKQPKFISTSTAPTSTISSHSKHVSLTCRSDSAPVSGETKINPFNLKQPVLISAASTSSFSSQPTCVLVTSRSDSTPVTGQSQISPFSLKQPAFISTASTSSISSHPMQKPYQQVSGNPFASLPNNNSEPPVNSTHLEHSSSRVIYQPISSTDSSDSEMPVLIPYTQQSQSKVQAPSSEDVIVIDDSDD